MILSEKLKTLMGFIIKIPLLHINNDKMGKIENKKK